MDPDPAASLTQPDPWIQIRLGSESMDPDPTASLTQPDPWIQNMLVNMLVSISSVNLLGHIFNIFYSI